MRIIQWLKILSAENGSELFLSTGAPPCARFQGQLKPVASDILQPGESRDIAYEVMDAVQQRDFEQQLEMNLALSVSGYGRFRINIFLQRNEVSIVARNIVAEIPSWQALRLPPAVTEIVMRRQGLLLFAGQKGAGKSTSVAALIDHRNSHSSGHIVTIEDPVEYVHAHKQSIVNQREVGVDTRNWHSALKNTLLQAPDVIFIGEIRDSETLEHALAFAQTGHLCISTVQAATSSQALAHLISLCPAEQRPQVLADLSMHLQCVVAQRLVLGVTKSRCAVFELLLGNPMVAQLILRGDFDGMNEMMKTSENHGMKTFDSALFELLQEGLIDEEEAMHHADSKNNLALKIQIAADVNAEGTTPSSAATRTVAQADSKTAGPPN